MRTFSAVSCAALALAALALCAPVWAQQLSEVQKPKEPLTLEQEGSFFVGGRPIHVEITEWNELGPDFAKAYGMPERHGRSDVRPVPEGAGLGKSHADRLPAWLLLASKTWETTPDGPRGCYEYFTRKGFPTYLAEQSSRGRADFDASGSTRCTRATAAPRPKEDAARHG